MAGRIIDLGGRFSNGFGFVSDNTSDELQETDFNDTLTNSTVVVKDGRSSFEEFTLRRTGVELKFGYAGLFSAIDNVFAPPAMVSFKRSKRIDETIVSSQDDNGNEISTGQVIENYGKMPVDINIQGLLIDMINHQYPSDKVRQLVDLFEYQGQWDVDGQVFRDQRIRSIYITGMEDGPVQGYMDTWKFSLTCRSIAPVEWFLKKNK